jgi:hypothetical protein
LLDEDHIVMHAPAKFVYAVKRGASVPDDDFYPVIPVAPPIAG